ncbi:MAG: cation transporter [Clostridia bacterium]|nr:cation transporter [Clostridia bacterium]
MKDSVKEKPSNASAETLQLTTAVLCTFLLFSAYVFSAPFYSQLLIYLFLLFNSRNVLRKGFYDLSAFSPSAKSLVAVSAFSALLYGVSTFDKRNCFLYAAICLSFAELGDFLSARFFKRSCEYHGFADRLSALIFPFALAVMVVTLIVDLLYGKDFFEVITHAFLVFVFACPCIISLAGILFGCASAKTAAQHGIAFECLCTSEKLGKVREIIAEQRGIVTETDFSLYDVYSTDNDKVKLLSVVSAIEAHFSHPFASAIITAAKSVDAASCMAENCFEIFGKGVCATVGNDKYYVGNKKLLKEKRVIIPDAVAAIDFGAYTPIYIAKNGAFAGVMLLYSKISYGTTEALEEIKSLSVRRILLSDHERADLKSSFDILLSEREKVLQEFKKGAKIKAMTVTEKPIAKADVVAVTSHADFADVRFKQPALPNALYALIIGRKAYSRLKYALVISAVLAMVFAFLAGLGRALLPVASAVAVSLPLLFCIGIMRTVLPQFTSLEEDKMFGKVNYTMKIEGMSCTHCSARVKTALESLRGVSANISLEEKTAHIKCPASTTAEILAKAVEDVGFTVVSTERV